MPSPVLVKLRRDYHRRICADILGLATGKHGKYYNNADGSSGQSVAIAKGLAERLGGPYCHKLPSAQGSGSLFAGHTARFLEDAFAVLHELRPGDWKFSTKQSQVGIAAYDQYAHLAKLSELATKYPEIEDTLGPDYLITPDIVVAKAPVSDAEIDADKPVIGNAKVAQLTPFRAANEPTPESTLHASVSCKWTMRSDRAQNARTEALNLIRNRKGRVPHIAVVTAEPTSSRLSSIAIGTGDVDCTYHIALPELVDAMRELAEANELAFGEPLRELETLISARRLRDISDLPFDLAI